MNVTSLLVFATAILLFMLSSCKTLEFVGYLTNESDNIQTSKPAYRPSSEYASILRDEFSNAFNFSISKKYYPYALNSLDLNSYNILLIASTEVEIPYDRPVKLFSPNLVTSQIKYDTIYTDVGASKIYILISASELGKQIILSNLISPNGIKGIITFGNSKHVLPFQAYLIEEKTLVGKVYKRKTIFKSVFQIQSCVEYPISLSLNYIDSGKCKFNQGKNYLLKPWSSVNVKLPNCILNSFSINNVMINKKLNYNSDILKYFNNQN